MTKGPIELFLEGVAPERYIPEESWRSSNPSDVEPSSQQHNISCKIIAEYIFEDVITKEDVGRLVERQNSRLANSHFRRTEFHEHLLREKPKYRELLEKLNERLEQLFSTPYKEDQMDIPTVAGEDEEEQEDIPTAPGVDEEEPDKQPTANCNFLEEEQEDIPTAPGVDEEEPDKQPTANCNFLEEPDKQPTAANGDDIYNICHNSPILGKRSSSDSDDSPNICEFLQSCGFNFAY